MTDKQFEEILKAVGCKVIVKGQPQNVRVALEKAFLQGFQDDVNQQAQEDLKRQFMRRRQYGQ